LKKHSLGAVNGAAICPSGEISPAGDPARAFIVGPFIVSAFRGI